MLFGNIQDCLVGSSGRGEGGVVQESYESDSRAVLASSDPSGSLAKKCLSGLDWHKCQIAVAMVAVSALVLAPAAGCTHSKPAVTQHKAASTGPTATLKICTTGDYLPLTYRDRRSGDYSGIDIDMAEDLAAHLGRAPVFVATTWGSLTTDLSARGPCDIAVGGISPTPARAQTADFTQPYLANGKTPLTTTLNADRFQTIDQINRPGVRVIEPAGGTNEQFARQHLPNATLIISQDNTAIFAQLTSGGADVMVTDVIEAVYQSKQHPELVAVHPDKPFTSDEKAYMLPKGSPLTSPTRDWLAHALDDGTFGRIYDQWMK
jgi:cyclohexadienyl dehydratase